SHAREVSWSCPAILALSMGSMMPCVSKLPSWAASSTTRSGSWCEVAAADSLVSKSVSVMNGLIGMPVLAVKASKTAWYALIESPAPRTQTLSGPVASACGELPDELLEQPAMAVAQARERTAADTRWYTLLRLLMRITSKVVYKSQVGERAAAELTAPTRQRSRT